MEGLEDLRVSNPGFTAPEVLLGNETRPGKIDMFSIGAVLYSLLSAQDPFNAENVKTTVRLNKLCEFDFSSICWRGISYQAIDFVQKLMSPDPETRLSVAEAFRHPFLSRPETGTETPIVSEFVFISCDG
jgi:serine/threonine protein kinase